MGPRFSLLVPTHRPGPQGLAVVSALADLDPGVFEVFVRDNSRDEEKAERGVRLASPLVHYEVAEECSAMENAKALLAHASGEYVMFLADDDAPQVGGLLAASALPRKGATILSGDYLVTSGSRESRFRYGRLDQASPVERVSTFFGGQQPLFLFYSFLRRELFLPAFELALTTPLHFPFLDQILVLLLLSGGVARFTPELVYHYDLTAWRAPGKLAQVFSGLGLPGELAILNYLFAALEGGVLLESAGEPFGARGDRKACASLWRVAMLRQLAYGVNAPQGTEVRRAADRVRSKWLAREGFSERGVLSDLCDVLARTDRRLADRYYAFWNRKLERLASL